ncbi:MAG: sugar phosphate isomerase/epimerase family protein [Acidimicrobiales bacterium]
MKLGFLTASQPQVELASIVAWAAAHGFDALEVATWPPGVNRPFEATHIDVTRLDAAGADAVRRLFADHHVELSALAYYDNNLHPDPDVRGRVHAHVRACIDAAQLLGVGMVGTFVGRDTTMTVADNLRMAEKVFPALVAYAGERGVKLMIENCPMEGWHPDGYPGNLAYSLELWDWMFGLGLYLNYDPSHLVFLGIDPMAALRAAGGRVIHAQAKDVELLPDGRNRVGVWGNAIERSNPWDQRWYRYRAPGLGAVDWTAVVDGLYQIGFDGVLSVEHEDPVWGGSAGKVRQGLMIGHGTLRRLIPGGED